MNIRFISLGFCEKFDENYQTQFCNSNQINNFFGNSVFHFKIDYSQIEDSISTGLQLKPQGGIFDPKAVKTYYYGEEKNDSKSEIRIERQPMFFAVLIPYPILRLFSNDKSYGDEGWGGNCYPFQKMKSSNSFEREKRFSDYRLKIDLSGEIRIHNKIGRIEFHNDFFENNCYPLFIQDHNELIRFINDLSGFYKSILGFNLKLENITKIVIPFFELSKEEAAGLEKSQSDDLPF